MSVGKRIIEDRRSIVYQVNRSVKSKVIRNTDNLQEVKLMDSVLVSSEVVSFCALCAKDNYDASLYDSLCNSHRRLLLWA